MYGIFTYIYHISFHQKQPNVGKYTIHGWYGVMLYLLNVPLVFRYLPHTGSRGVVGQNLEYLNRGQEAAEIYMQARWSQHDQHVLGGGFKYFLCSSLFGEDFQFD